MRKYFVYYSALKRNGEALYGNTEMLVTGLVHSIRIIQDIEACIKRNNKYKQVVVINWRRFEEPHALIGDRGEA